MRFVLFLLSSFLFAACINIPEPKGSEASVAQEQIKENKEEAQMAQKEYQVLQSQRISE